LISWLTKAVQGVKDGRSRNGRQRSKEHKHPARQGAYDLHQQVRSSQIGKDVLDKNLGQGQAVRQIPG